MAKRSQNEDFRWDEVSGRALAFLCLHLADKRTGTLLEQAEFLAKFGLPLREAAVILGTTEDSLRVMAGRKARSGKTTSAKVTTKAGS